MMIADLHIHSRFSRATSQEMTIPKIAEYAKLKGIKLVGTGDFTHPLWLKELKANLKFVNGLYEYSDIKFILSVEVNNIYTKNGRLRRIHNIIFAPDFETAEKINRYLSKFGNLEVDGRPTLSVPAEEMLAGLLDISPDIFLIPSHIWTPWFSLFGANSGFDSIEECFGNLTEKVFSLETGLSSDPKMNWRLSALDRFTLVSNSDAHSPNRLGREANVFSEELDYFALRDVLKNKDRGKFLYTIEFYPEEGKYHFDGHRKCGVRLSPKEARMNNNLCPVCFKNITIGVMHRVELLADREEGFVPSDAIPFKNLIPLEEIIADVLGIGRDTAGVKNEYLKLCRQFGSEFEILLNTPIQELKNATDERIAIGIERMRRGDILINPGYDGEFGTIKIFKEKEATQPQLGLF
uniref:DNA helicase UvrD n=1 Tax=candidate division WOR-3 bacterium TaxID=2052148 RepID=A0A7C4TC43_UNCW3